MGDKIKSPFDDEDDEDEEWDSEDGNLFREEGDTEEDVKIKKALAKRVILISYFRYCLAEKPNTVFVLSQGDLTARQVVNVMDSIKETEPWVKFVDEVSSLVYQDKEYEAYLEEQELRCEQCGFLPIKIEKCSNRHPEWIRWQNVLAKEWELTLEQHLKRPVKVFKNHCPQCGHVMYTSSGIDKKPMEGVET